METNSYTKLFLLSLVLYMSGCVYVVVSDDKTAMDTETAPLIEVENTEQIEVKE